jgi:hypothetical protein
MFEQIAREPFWLQAWIGWLILVNTASVFFLRRAEGRSTLLAWIASVLTMGWLFESFGYTRILGLAHLIWWTPLVIWLFRRRAGFGEGAFGGWARWLLLTNSASLAIDAVDVARFALGDRGPV